MVPALQDTPSCWRYLRRCRYADQERFHLVAKRDRFRDHFQSVTRTISSGGFRGVTITTMPKYVAFLRAINVGGHTVKMDYLRRLFEALAFSDVQSFIASGNIIFDSTSKSTKALEKKIEDHLQAALGYEVKTFIRSTSELMEIARYKPFPDAEPEGKDNALYIGFLADNPGDEATRKVVSLATEVDAFRINGRELYWLCRKKISESEVSGAMLAKALGMEMTLRNSTTVRKLAAKYR